MNLVSISVIQMLSASTQLVITTVHVMLDTVEMVLIVLVSHLLVVSAPITAFKLLHL